MVERRTERRSSDSGSGGGRRAPSAAAGPAAQRRQDRFAGRRRSDEERRRLVSALLDGRERERRAVAGALHDQALQSVAAVRLSLTRVRERPLAPDVATLVDQVLCQVDRVIADIRRLSFEVRPPSLDLPDGLRDALHAYASTMPSHNGADVRVDVQVLPAGPTAAAELVYRLAERALSWLRTLAGTTGIVVSVHRRGRGLRLRVVRDGRPADVHVWDAATEPVDITEIRELTRRAGGWAQVDSGPGPTTVVECWVPET